MAGGVGRKGADFHRPRAFGRVDEARTGAENYPGAIGGLSPGVGQLVAGGRFFEWRDRFMARYLTPPH